MRYLNKNFFIFLTVFCALMLLSLVVLAKPQFEGASGDAPYGQTGDPGGTKLTGVICIKYKGIVGAIASSGAEFSIRLQREKSGFPYVFTGVVTDPIDFGDPHLVLLQLYSEVETQVEDTFFDGANMCFKVKAIKNEGTLDVGVNDEIAIADIELSAKPFVEGECEVVVIGE